MSIIARLDSQVDEVLFGSLNAQRRAADEPTIDPTNERQAQTLDTDADAATRAPNAEASEESRAARSYTPVDAVDDLPVWML